MSQNVTEQKKETKAPKKTIGDVVRAVAALVQTYAQLAERQETGKKLVSALTAIGNVLGEGNISLLTVEDAVIDTNGTRFLVVADSLKADITDLMALSVEVNNGIVKVKGYVEDDVLEADEADIAAATLTLWEQVRGARKSPATSSRAQGERITQADTPFPIYASCDICDKVVVKGGERAYRHDWNSLRHFSQKHAIDAHGSNGFTNLVSDAWAQAKEAFISDNAEEFHIPPDSDLPGFTLIAHK